LKSISSGRAVVRSTFTGHALGCARGSVPP
jgi:hypothetical protein